ncbi:MAG: hypothetical protein HW387_1224 [Parachlamydiales bacterium]|nr:hypothetical protein [Parachlamydiales bacterium]
MNPASPTLDECSPLFRASSQPLRQGQYKTVSPLHVIFSPVKFYGNTSSPGDNSISTQITSPTSAGVANAVSPILNISFYAPAESPCTTPTHALIESKTPNRKMRLQAEYEISIIQRCNAARIPGVPPVQCATIPDKSDSTAVLMPWYKHKLEDQFNKKTPTELKEIFRQICLTVSEVHKIDIAHFDIKPQNIVLDKNDQPFLIDFGCAIEVDPLTGNPQEDSYEINLGTTTQTYSPPKEYDLFPKARDVFSLGLTMFEVSTGGKTIPGELIGKIFENFHHYIMSANDKDIIDTIDANISDPDLKNLLNGMMLLDQKQRFTMQQVIEHPYFQ